MKKPILLLVIMLFLANASESRSSVAGTDLTYTWVSDSTYSFVYTMYNNCKGGPAPDSVVLCVKNSCSTFNTTIMLQKDSGISGDEVFKPNCPNQHTTCTDPLSAMPGFVKWAYTGTITLPFRCTQWEFSVTVDGRDSLVSNLASLKNVWTDAMLNNEDSFNVSSPYFKVPPVAYVCNNAPYDYFSGPVSANGDSMYFKLEYPSHAPSCSDTFGNPNNADTFNNTAYNLFNNPFPANNTFSINRRNGTFDFTSSMDQNPVVSVLCTFYRNGKVMGHVMRDILLVIADCNNTLPLIYSPQLISGNLDSNSGNFSIEAGNTIAFSFLGYSANTDAAIVIDDNHIGACTGSLLAYANQYTDSVTGILIWTTALSDTGWHYLSLELHDTVCRPQYAIIDQGYLIPIHVILASTGINSLTINNNISIYPNPTSGIVNIYRKNTASPVNITITDAVGRLVLKTEMDNNRAQVNMAPYQNGIYLVHLSSDQVNYTTKIILQR